MKKLLKKLFCKKKDLRDVCIEKYGEEFAALYDSLGRGIPIGNLYETQIVLSMIEEARKEV